MPAPHHRSCPISTHHSSINWQTCNTPILLSISIRVIMELPKKIRKPLIEKRRRARINDSLEQLKEILLRDTALDVAGSSNISNSNHISSSCSSGRPAKLEKADILEMTIRYIQALQRCTTDSRIPKTTPSNKSAIAIDAADGLQIRRRRRCILGDIGATNNNNGQCHRTPEPRADEENRHPCWRPW